MTSSSSGTNTKYSCPIVEKRIDNRMELCPSLDYSFLDAQKLEGTTLYIRTSLLFS